MTRRAPSAEWLTRTLRGQVVSHVTKSDSEQVVVHFTSGASLAAHSGSVELSAAPALPEDARQPTKRQLEYLVFIHSYMVRFKRAPAESDIERHFMISAPSVNQMMQTLERLGYIARERGVPRSIRICIELPQNARLQ